MDAPERASVLDFEVYLLVTMKYGMLVRQAEREAKLAEHGLTLETADRTHERVAGWLANTATQFENLSALVGGAASKEESVTFKGVLWPDFDFTATRADDGSIRSAQYRRARGRAEAASSPANQPSWSMDAADFTQHFGAYTISYQSPLFDETLPAHESHDFEWEGRRYRAGFSWGLFLFASVIWT